MLGVHAPRLTEDDTRLLQLVAFRVALAVDNARLFEEERAARREAEAASRAKDEFLTTIFMSCARHSLRLLAGFTWSAMDCCLRKKLITGLRLSKKCPRA